jgi:hypothetical protein
LFLLFLSFFFSVPSFSCFGFVARQKIRAASAGDFFCRFALIGSLGVAT